MVRVALKTMRCGPFLVMFALLLGAAPALGAEPTVPYPMAAAKSRPQSAPKAKTRRRSRRAVQTAAGQNRPPAARRRRRESRPNPKTATGQVRAGAGRVRRNSRRRAPEDPGGAAVVGRLYRRGQRRRPDARRDQELPEAQQGQGHRRAHAGRARQPGRRGARPRAGIRLERGGRSGHRHPHRPADQDGAECARGRARHALVVGAWRGAGRDLPHRRSATSNCPRCSSRRRRSRRRARSNTACCATTISSSAACRA